MEHDNAMVEIIRDASVAGIDTLVRSLVMTVGGDIDSIDVPCPGGSDHDHSLMVARVGTTVFALVIVRPDADHPGDGTNGDENRTFTFETVEAAQEYYREGSRAMRASAETARKLRSVAQLLRDRLSE